MAQATIVVDNVRSGSTACTAGNIFQHCKATGAAFKVADPGEIEKENFSSTLRRSIISLNLHRPSI